MKKFMHAILFLIAINSFSQNEIECITTIPDNHISAYLDHQEDVKNLSVDFDINDSNSTITMKLKIHVIRRSNGTDGLSASDVSLSVEQLIGAYEQLNVTFEYCDVNYINNDEYYSNIQYSLSNSSTEYEMALANNDDNAINIYFVPNATSGTRNVCGWSSFPSYEDDYGKNWTVMDNNCATNGSTLAHELGHYFNLLHTHETARGSENVERVGGLCTNCNTAGDELCDTPADPRLSISTNVSGCTYYGTNTDSCGETYEPNPTNVMSYSGKSCRDFFSTGQINRILLSIATDRTNVASYCNGCKLEVYITKDVESGETDSQSASSTIEANNTIKSNATAIYKAGKTVTLNNGFYANSGSGVSIKIEECGLITSSSKNLQPQINILNVTEETSLFIEGENSSLSIYPNPTNGLFKVQGSSKFTSYSIQNILGGQIMSNEVNESQLNIDISKFTNGIYFLELQTEDGEVFRKKVIKD